MAMEPFVWGRGGSKKTPEQIAREREIADAMLAQGMDFSPVADPLQGVARVANAAVGAFKNYRADKAETEGREGARAEIAKLLGGGGGMPPTGQPTPNQGMSATPAPMQGDIGSYAEAIAKKESGGNYGALGPVLSSGSYAGDRAYGKYQVMGKNIPEWTQAALGRQMTPQEFLADQAAQDAVFQHRFGGYVQKYGNPQDAASAWFTGGPLKGNEGKKDVLGTTAQNYVDSFNQNLGAASPSIATGANPAPMAQQPQQGGGNAEIAQLMGALDNPWLSDGQRQVVTALLQQKMAAQQPQSPEFGFMFGPDGSLIRTDKTSGSIAELGDFGKPQDAPEKYRQYTDDMGVTWQENTTTGQRSVLRDAPKPEKITPTQLTKLMQERDALSPDDPQRAFYDKAIEREAAGSGMSIQTNPDGTFSFTQGNTSGVKLTEQQGKDVGFYTRGMDADATLGKLDTQLTDFAQKNADKIPLGLGNYMQTPEFQQAKQAADSFLTALLRKDTGAAITPQEFEIYGAMFLPVPGDSTEVVQQKRRARKVALLAVRSGMGTAEAVAQANDNILGMSAPNPGVNPDAGGWTEIDGVKIREKK